MRFVISVALKYLTPRRRQLSVSVISVVSLFVISLVVWLAIVFLSVSEGIQTKWVRQLLAIHPPIRLTPTEAYYDSYYHQIDAYAAASDYQIQSIAGKSLTMRTDPYDPLQDQQLPPEFPVPHLDTQGRLLDIVKETVSITETVSGTPPSPFETTLGNLRLRLFQRTDQGIEEVTLSQPSYFSSIDPKNPIFLHTLLPPTEEDVDHLFHNLPHEAFQAFFDQVLVQEIQNPEDWVWNASCYPEQGTVTGCGILKDSELLRIIVPNHLSQLPVLKERWKQMGFQTRDIEVGFLDGEVVGDMPPLLLAAGTTLHSDTIYLPKTSSQNQVEAHISGKIQNVTVSGSIPLSPFQLKKTSLTVQNPFWGYPHLKAKNNPLGDGILVSKNYRNHGVKLGDMGYISYFIPTTSSPQEQRIPVYIAGFYDPGLVAMGNRFVFADVSLIEAMSSSSLQIDGSVGTGLNLWIQNVQRTQEIQALLEQELEKKGLLRYWKVESFRDYEFIRPVLQQLQSDQTLFTLIAGIILLVACSNVVSMLILLVNDKKKEIGILLAMGASRASIASIFCLCGCITGVLSFGTGSLLALFTMRHIHKLVHILNVLQGHEVFHAAFYGNSLPDQASGSVLLFVGVATLFLSGIAGLIPAVKAARIQPTDSLRIE